MTSTYYIISFNKTRRGISHKEERLWIEKKLLSGNDINWMGWSNAVLIKTWNNYQKWTQEGVNGWEKKKLIKIVQWKKNCAYWNQSIRAAEAAAEKKEKQKKKIQLFIRVAGLNAMIYQNVDVHDGSSPRWSSNVNNTGTAKRQTSEWRLESLKVNLKFMFF